MRMQASLLFLGVFVGIVGSAGGLLASPQLAGITREFRCVGCHGELHGAVQLDSLPYNALVMLTGDVAQPGWVTVNDVFPYRAGEPRSITVEEFIKVYGATTDFSLVSLYSTDGGRVSLERKYLSDKSLLMPYLEGIRFADENQHISTWLKGINRIVVVGSERKIKVDGKEVSMGEALLGPLVTVSTESGHAMLANLKTGDIYRGEYARLQQGRPVASLIAGTGFRTLAVVNAAGERVELTREEAVDALLGIVDGKNTLILPQESRRKWILDVVEIQTRM